MMNAKQVINELKSLGKTLDTEMPEIRDAMTRSYVTQEERKMVNQEILLMKDQAKRLKVELASMLKQVLEIQEDFRNTAEEYTSKMEATSKNVDDIVDHLKKFGFKEDERKSDKTTTKNRCTDEHDCTATEKSVQESQLTHTESNTMYDIPEEPILDQTVVDFMNETLLKNQRNDKVDVEQNNLSTFSRSVKKTVSAVPEPKSIFQNTKNMQIVTPSPVKEVPVFEEVTPGLWVKTTSQEHRKNARKEKPLNLKDSGDGFVNGTCSIKGQKEIIERSRASPEDNMASPQLPEDTLQIMNQYFAKKSSSVTEFLNTTPLSSNFTCDEDPTVTTPTVMVTDPRGGISYLDYEIPPSPQMSETVAMMMEEFEATGKVTVI